MNDPKRSESAMYDLLIVNTKIVDGSGNPWLYGNVATKDGFIVAVGSALSDEAETIIDGEGLVTCPGRTCPAPSPQMAAVLVSQSALGAKRANNCCRMHQEVVHLGFRSDASTT